MIKLICPECRHENEPERIYCHSCGARLDRSAAASKVAPKETIKQTQKRVRRLFDPTWIKVRVLLFQISKLLAGACILAVLIQMILPPDVPPPPKDTLNISQINFALENAISQHTPAQLEYSQDQVNDHLRYVLKNKQSMLNKPFVQFQRAFVQLREGGCDITQERTIFGYSLYATADYTVRVGEGKPVITNKGGHIGRLPIHPTIMQFGDIMFSDIWAALDRERKLVIKMGGIEFHDKRVVLISPISVQ